MGFTTKTNLLSFETADDNLSRSLSTPLNTIVDVDMWAGIPLRAFPPRL